MTKYVELKRIGDNIKKQFSVNCIYDRKYIFYKLEQPLEKANEYTFRAEFIDGFPSAFTLTVNGVNVACCAGMTSCNTGRTRTSVFTVRLSDEQYGEGLSDIRLGGMPGVISLSVSPGTDVDAVRIAKSERVKPDEVKAIPTIKNPIQLIINYGSDSDKREQLPLALERLREYCPFYRALGFNGFESYVKWNFVEYDEGVFDWSYYDAVIDLSYEYGFKWFPLIIGGSAYALPEWRHGHVRAGGEIRGREGQRRYRRFHGRHRPADVAGAV